MKNILALTVLASGVAGAWAQSTGTVQLYGVVDGGVNQVSGLKVGRDNRVVSGIMDGSRIGVRVNEDLGGGFRALATLEHRLELNTGTVSNRPASGSQLPDRLSSASIMGLPAALQPAVTGVGAGIGGTVGVNLRGGFWDRQVFAGLVTPVGAVLAGRQYTPAYEVFASFDTLKTQSSLSAGQLASLPSGVDIRVDNALSYRIQQGPVAASAMWAFGNVSGAASANRLWGAQASYRTEAFGVGVGYNTRNNELGQKSLTSTVFGASAQVGPGTVSASFAGIQDDNPSGLSTISASVQALGATAAQAALVQNAFIAGLTQDSRLMHVGYTLVTGQLTSYLSYSRLDDRTRWNADVESFGVAYSYALSKRTDINAVVARFNNKGLAQAAPGGAGFLGGVTASAGTDSTSLALGVRHRF